MDVLIQNYFFSLLFGGGGSKKKEKKMNSYKSTRQTTPCRFKAHKTYILYKLVYTCAEKLTPYITSNIKLTSAT